MYIRRQTDLNEEMLNFNLCFKKQKQNKIKIFLTGMKSISFFRVNIFLLKVKKKLLATTKRE